jgi:hypothetical protein
LSWQKWLTCPTQGIVVAVVIAVMICRAWQSISITFDVLQIEVIQHFPPFFPPKSGFSVYSFFSLLTLKLG